MFSITIGYSKTYLKPLKKRPKIGFQDGLLLNAERVLQNAPRERSAILSTCIKLRSVFKTFVLSIFEI